MCRGEGVRIDDEQGRASSRRGDREPVIPGLDGAAPGQGLFQLVGQQLDPVQVGDDKWAIVCEGTASPTLLRAAWVDAGRHGGESQGGREWDPISPAFGASYC